MSIAMVLRVLGLGGLVAGVVLGANAARFAMHAVHAEGRVERVEARDTRCTASGTGKHQHRRRYDCTRFAAIVRFEHAGRAHVVSIDAGKRKGHAQPTTDADMQAGDRVPMTFAADRPDAAFRGGSGSMRLWGPSLLALLVGGVLLFVSFARKATPAR